MRVFGAVLGAAQLGDAFKASQELVKAATAAPQEVQIIAPGQRVGMLNTAWGATAPVVAAGPASLPAWSGLPMKTEAAVTPPPPGTPLGTPVGILSLEVGANKRDVVVQTSETLSGPSWWWRITR